MIEFSQKGKKMMDIAKNRKTSEIPKNQINAGNSGN